eukprot:1673745-Pleurochrysis_carterae.AAC.1
MSPLFLFCSLCDAACKRLSQHLCTYPCTNKGHRTRCAVVGWRNTRVSDSSADAHTNACANALTLASTPTRTPTCMLLSTTTHAAHVPARTRCPRG